MSGTSPLENIKHLGRYIFVRRVVTLLCVLASALLQTYVIQAFVNPANLLSGGFTGIALLIDRVTSLVGVSFPTSLGVLALNAPVALFCWRSISKRFVIFSMIQVALLSLFLRIFSFQPILGETLLNVIFGGVLNGIAIAIALKSGASTAGTDFIALYVSNKTGKTIWPYVFAANCCVLGIFGAIFGWEHAAYSIVFQFISTKAIDGFYHRYNRSTLIITTKRPKEVADIYTATFHHGASIIDAPVRIAAMPLALSTRSCPPMKWAMPSRPSAPSIRAPSSTCSKPMTLRATSTAPAWTSPCPAKCYPPPTTIRC